MKYKLLVAENAFSERRSLCRTLNTHLGAYLTIIEAANGTQALDLFDRESPQIVILGIEMPDLTGLEVAQKIRECNKTCALLFISDLDNFSYAKQAISLRALDYLTKPYEEQKLVHCVEESIQYCAHFQPFSHHSLQSRPSDQGPGPAQFADSVRLSLVREDISAFLEQHYMEELSMKTVAHAMNYSDAYFCKLFKQCFHVTFSIYLNQYRVRKAKVLMESSRSSVKEIAAACGYPDANYFARVFKRITNQTPSEYRLSLAKKGKK